MHPNGKKNGRTSLYNCEYSLFHIYQLLTLFVRSIRQFTNTIFLYTSQNSYLAATNVLSLQTIIGTADILLGFDRTLTIMNDLVTILTAGAVLYSGYHLLRRTPSLFLLPDRTANLVEQKKAASPAAPGWLREYAPGIPPWPHTYVYSSQPLLMANPSQKAFFAVFRWHFLRDEYLDLKGNNSYAFALLFELLADFDLHANTALLSSQIHRLCIHYPFIKTLANRYLEIKTGQQGIRQQPPVTADPPAKEGLIIDKIKGSVTLSSYERELLRHVAGGDNHFFNIDQCSRETARLYLRALSAADYSLRKSNSSLADEIGYLANKAVRSRLRLPLNSPNYVSLLDTFVKIIYTNLFRHCENTVRTSYGNARKLSTNLSALPPDCQRAYQDRLLSLLIPIIDSFTPLIEPPTRETEIALNTQHSQRWKLSFAALVDHKLQDPPLFYQELLQLLQLNPLNSSRKDMLLAAAIALLPKDNLLAASCYLRYLQLCPQDTVFGTQKQPTALKKGLFGNHTARLAAFESIARQLMADRQLEPALAALPAVFAAHQRRIQLDPTAVAELQTQHAGTVALLNTYLQDEAAPDHLPGETQTPGLQQPAPDPRVALLQLFHDNHFSLSMQQLQVLAQQHQQMANHLINSINEQYYELLDDNLIDICGDTYTLHPPYFQKIAAHG